MVINSEAGRAYHERIGYRPREWVLIPNGINTQQFRADPDARVSVRRELGLADEALLIGYVARYDPRKDYATFLYAARRLKDLGLEVHFLLSGDG